MPSTPDARLSRREVAALLGFRSDFKVRQLEKVGRLHAIRGAMGQAWYARDQVLALAAEGSGARAAGASSPVVAGSPPARPRLSGSAPGRWTDAALIAHLRDGAPTVVDLVADTGISISRAERVYRFWLAHDRHPVAAQARGLGTGGGVGPPHGGRRPERNHEVVAISPRDHGDPPPANSDASAVLPRRGGVAAAGSSATTGERRGQTRLDRDALIRQLRDPDPARRARAFRLLRRMPGPPALPK